MGSCVRRPAPGCRIKSGMTGGGRHDGRRVGWLGLGGGLVHWGISRPCRVCRAMMSAMEHIHSILEVNGRVWQGGASGVEGMTCRGSPSRQRRMFHTLTLSRQRRTFRPSRERGFAGAGSRQGRGGSGWDRARAGVNKGAGTAGSTRCCGCGRAGAGLRFGNLGTARPCSGVSSRATAPWAGRASGHRGRWRRRRWSG